VQGSSTSQGQQGEENEVEDDSDELG
ncbi:MAG: hypothetical protein EZS28_033797, partial [Streblomastix strix]